MPTDDTDLLMLLMHLLTRLDQLIALLADEPALRAGLLRERARILSRCPAQEGASWLHALPLLRPADTAQEQDRGRSAARLRRSAYRALFGGAIDGRIFDGVLLIASRARARRPGRGQERGLARDYVGSPSDSLSRGSSSAGPGGGGGGAAPSVPASVRRKRSRLSTIRTCA